MSPPTSADPAALATEAGAEAPPAARRWVMLGVISFAFMMTSIDQTIVASALPELSVDLHAPLNWAGWTITVYSLARVVTMPLIGRLSDRYSRRGIFIASIALFTVASLGCGIIHDVYALIALRAVQAVGGGAFVPSATGLVTDHFGRNRDRVIGMFSSILPIGGMIGPVLGGVIVAYWSWRGIFLVNVPIGLVLVALALRYVPGGRPPSDGSRLDIPGMATLGVTILAAMLGITYLGEPGSSLLGAGLLVPEGIAVVAALLLARHIVRAEHPFVTRDLLLGRGLGVLSVLNFLYGAAAVGMSALAPLYAVQRYGLPILQAGTLLTARAVGITTAAAGAAWVIRRTGYRGPIAVGFSMTCVGLLLMAAPPQGMGPYPWLAISSGLVGVGLGIANPATSNAALEAAPAQAAGMAGLRLMFRQSGSIAGVAVATAILARADNPGLAQAYVLVGIAVLVLAVVPLAVLIPEHRGAW